MNKTLDLDVIKAPYLDVARDPLKRNMDKTPDLDVIKAPDLAVNKTLDLDVNKAPDLAVNKTPDLDVDVNKAANTARGHSSRTPPLTANQTTPRDPTATNTSAGVTLYSDYLVCTVVKPFLI